MLKKWRMIRPVRFFMPAACIIMCGSCAHYRKYTAIDQNLENLALKQAVQTLQMPYNELQGKSVSLRINECPGIPAGTGEVVKRYAVEEMLKRGISPESEAEAEVNAEISIVYSLEVYGLTARWLWIPLIYGRKQRDFIVKMTVEIFRKGKIIPVYEILGIGHIYFRESTFFEIIGPFKKTAAFSKSR